MRSLPNICIAVLLMNITHENKRLTKSKFLLSNNIVTHRYCRDVTTTSRLRHDNRDISAIKMSTNIILDVTSMYEEMRNALCKQ